jgi:3-isopropylmalate/(R)-2-methylmalate dehydratase large subunit
MHAIAKIFAKRGGRREVVPGEIIWASPDYIMMHDRGIARVMDRLSAMGADQIPDPSRVVVVFDHFYPPPREQDAEAQRRARAFMAQQGITRFYPGDGIAHLVLPEKGYAYPGILIVGTDSHTVTNGAAGCVATGLGHSDIASVLALGSTWFRVPEVVRIDLYGTLKPGVSAKDIMLKLLQEFGEDGFVYQALEFAGPTVHSLSMDERFVLCNMSVELGAKCGYIQPDEVAFEWLRGRTDPSRWEVETTDSRTDYAKTIEVDVENLEPLVAVPHDLSHIERAGDLAGTRVDEAVLGTCTGGRLEDFRVAAKILKGRRVAPHVRLVVNPGSVEVYRRALREGLIDILVEAGAIMGTPGCGPCGGCQLGMLAAGEVAISTSSRNFRGRMGSPDSQIYVASPATVAASAVAGYIVDPRRFLEEA